MVDDFMVTESDPIPAICCYGELTFSDVTPGGKVGGTFELCNCGENGSLLNWGYESSPNWQDAIFEIEPDTGSDLPEGECVTIYVNITAPSPSNEEFTGVITMRNEDDPSDICEVSVTLTTPRNRGIIFLFFERIFERFPVLKTIFGL
jgi:hypothetical protein